jgi:DNA-binding NarL/FixJ family response regulator
VIVIDPQKLRQAALVRLLEDWAHTNGFTVVAISTPEELNTGATGIMVMLNVGGDSVRERGPQFWIKIARSVLAHVPLVILSDREDRDEVRAAFDDGARGFITTNLDPIVALEAMTFLSRGGSFFPLSVIHDERSEEILKPVHLANPDPVVGVRTRVRVSARLAAWELEPHEVNAPTLAPLAQANFPLTPRQLEVLHRLKEGKPNKLIARDLKMTEATVKVHVRQILRKFGVANRTQAVLCATDMLDRQIERRDS